jgi:ribosomal protein S18 acetylase RimI-like enzyme
MEATLTWVPPGGAGNGLWDLVKQGVLLMPLRFGPSSLMRLQEMMTALDQMEQRLMRHRPHWYLSMVAVRAHLRGRGVGSGMILQHLADVVDVRPALDDSGRPLAHGYPVALLTQFESNVRLYRSLGFEVIEENTLGTRAGGGIRNWFMLRESRYGGCR